MATGRYRFHPIVTAARSLPAPSSTAIGRAGLQKISIGAGVPRPPAVPRPIAPPRP